MVPATHALTWTRAQLSPALPTSLTTMEILTTDVKPDVLQWQVPLHVLHAQLPPPRVRPLALLSLLALPTSLIPTTTRQMAARLVALRLMEERVLLARMPAHVLRWHAKLARRTKHRHILSVRFVQQGDTRMNLVLHRVNFVAQEGM